MVNGCTACILVMCYNEEVSTLDEARLHIINKLFSLQIAKNKITYSKLCHVAKHVGDSYPIYDIFIRHRELENF